MPRYKLILNPASDRGHTRDRTKSIQHLVEELLEQHPDACPDCELSWVATERPRHAIELASAAAAEGYNVVVAVGGDGTVHEVVNGLMQADSSKRPALGVLPVGSGNDFAHNVGVPSELAQAIHCLFNDSRRCVDIGTITDGTGRTEYWNNTIGIGFSGAVNIASKRLIKQFRGFLLYLVAVLQTILFKPQALNAKLQITEDYHNTRCVSMISLCNGPREGGGFPVAPDAVMDDGLITYTIMRRVNRLQMLYFLPIVMSAAHMKYKRFFEGGTTTHFSIETDKTMAIHTDGETFGPWEADVRKLDVTLVPAALEVMVC